MTSCSQSTYHTKLDHYPMAADRIIAVPIKRITSQGAAIDSAVMIGIFPHIDRGKVKALRRKVYRMSLGSSPSRTDIARPLCEIAFFSGIPN